MTEIAGASNFASKIATLSISIFSNTESKYNKKIAKFIKKLILPLKSAIFHNQMKKILKKLLKLLEMMKW